MGGLTDLERAGAVIGDVIFRAAYPGKSAQRGEPDRDCPRKTPQNWLRRPELKGLEYPRSKPQSPEVQPIDFCSNQLMDGANHRWSAPGSSKQSLMQLSAWSMIEAT